MRSINLHSQVPVHNEKGIFLAVDIRRKLSNLSFQDTMISEVISLLCSRS